MRAVLCWKNRAVGTCGLQNFIFSDGDKGTHSKGEEISVATWLSYVCLVYLHLSNKFISLLFLLALFVIGWIFLSGKGSQLLARDCISSEDFGSIRVL